MSASCVVARTLYKPGTGRIVGEHDRIRLQYYAARSQVDLMHGAFIENTFDIGQPLAFEIGDNLMLPGIDQALVGTRVGSTWRLKIDLTTAFAGGAVPPRIAGSTVMLEIFVVQAEPVDPATTFAAWFSRVALPVAMAAVAAEPFPDAVQSSSEAVSIQDEVSVVRSALAELKMTIESHIRIRLDATTPSMIEELSRWRKRATTLQGLQDAVTIASQLRDRSNIGEIIVKIDELGAETIRGWLTIAERFER